MTVSSDTTLRRTVAVTQTTILWLKALALRFQRDTGRTWTMNDVIEHLLRNNGDDENSEPLLFTIDPPDESPANEAQHGDSR